MSGIAKFKTKKDALAVINECRKNGYRAGVRGNGPWMVEESHDSEGFRVWSDLHTDGMFHEYRRKEIAP